MDNFNFAEDLKGSESRIDAGVVTRNLNDNALFANACAFAAEERANVENLNSFFGGGAGNADEKHLSGNELPIVASVTLNVDNLHAPLKLTCKKLNVIIRSDDRYCNMIYVFITCHARYKAFDVVASSREQSRDS